MSFPIRFLFKWRPHLSACSLNAYVPRGLWVTSTQQMEGPWAQLLTHARALLHWLCWWYCSSLQPLGTCDFIFMNDWVSHSFLFLGNEGERKTSSLISYSELGWNCLELPLRKKGGLSFSHKAKSCPLFTTLGGNCKDRKNTGIEKKNPCDSKPHLYHLQPGWPRTPGVSESHK